MVANTFASQLLVSTSKQSCVPIAESNNSVALPPLNSQNGNLSEGPVAILWDIENCPVPSDVRPEDVAGNIRMALRVHPLIKGAVKMFSAYGDFNAFPRRLREGCQRTGVKLIDVPNGRKDAADKAILVDMFLFALDNCPPSFIMLISGDVDFAPALHILGQRGYTVILVIPSGVGVSSALSNAGRFVWDWPRVARGEGFAPSTWPSMSPCYGPSEIAGCLMGCSINENTDGHEEEAILYRGISQSYYNSKDFSIVSQSLSEYTSGNALALPCFSTDVRSQSLPLGVDELTAGASASSPNRTNANSWVQPGDINVLKGQLVKLLEFSGGRLPIARIPAEYQKLFSRPLYMSEYGALKLVNLLKKMSEVITIEGKGQKKFVHLKNTRAGPACSTLASSRDKKGKGLEEENRDHASSGSSEELSDEERVVMEEPNKGVVSNTDCASLSEPDNRELERFKYELQEILVSYSCRIFLSCFEEVYLQRYKRPLDYRRFGVLDLEQLFNKVKDVVVLHEEPASKMKFVAALGC